MRYGISTNMSMSGDGPQLDISIISIIHDESGTITIDYDEGTDNAYSVLGLLLVAYKMQLEIVMDQGEDEDED